MSEYPLVEAILAMTVVVSLMIACLCIMHVACEAYTCSIKLLVEKIKKSSKNR